MSERRLRIAGVIVQPILMWDDGDELTAGPQTQPITVPLSALPDLPQALTADLELLERSPDPTH